MKLTKMLLTCGCNCLLSPRRFWGMVACGMLLILTLAAKVSWGGWAFWREAYGMPMVILVALAYLTSAIIASRLKFLSRMEGVSAIALAVTLGILAIVVFLAFGRIYYSRSFLLIAWFCSLIWLPLAYYWGTTAAKMNLAVVPGGVSDELVALPGIDWKLLRDPQDPVGSDGIVVDLHQKLSEKWVRFLSECSLRKISVYHSAIVYETITGRLSLAHLTEGFVEDFKLAPLYAGVKRFADMVVTLIMAPLFLLIGAFVWLAIKLDSSGPALFCQERVGQNGVPFRMYKFRSMRVGTEKEKASFALQEDERITRIGRFIRRAHLDEIPQFWNVIRGDMSLIGPRPEQVSFAAQFSDEIPYYSYRHLVKPGLTGWAQVTQGYAAGVDQNRVKLERDLYYIKNFSFWIDFWILCKTLRVTLTGFGSR